MYETRNTIVGASQIQLKHMLTSSPFSFPLKLAPLLMQSEALCLQELHPLTVLLESCQALCIGQHSGGS